MPNKRKIRIRLTSRRPEDPLAILQAIKMTFPRDEIEIEVSQASQTAAETVPNEQLEAKASEVSSNVLEQKAKDAVGLPPPSPTGDPVPKKQQRLRTWLNTTAMTLKVSAKVVAIAKSVKQIFQ